MPVAAIESLVALIDHSHARTVTEFMMIIEQGANTLKSNVQNAISLSAGCDLFSRFVVQSLGQVPRFEECRDHLLKNGRFFVDRAKAARTRIAEVGADYIRDDSVVFLHAFSRVVVALLVEAAKRGTRFRAIVTESLPTGLGARTASVLREHGIPVAVISDSAIGYAIGQCDLVMVGAEGVVENGGIINALGTYPIATLAKAAGKRLYVVAETHKFVRAYPLSQYDLPFEQKVVVFHSSGKEAEEAKKEKEQKEDKSKERPLVDFTGPEYITALITENGVLTPGAVSEELIKIWH